MPISTEKANKLLDRFLTEEQRICLNTHRYITTIGSAGNSWLIFWPDLCVVGAQKFLPNGHCVDGHCVLAGCVHFQPLGASGLPNADALLATKLLIETNEAGFERVLGREIVSSEIQPA